MEPTHYDYLELKRIYTPEGYVDKQDNYHYFRRDHLGSVREVWKATDSIALTVQRTCYYPSGLPWEYQAGDSASLQPYKYGGKEFVETHGLDMYDSHARWYYATIMRPTTMDPLAEKYYSISPYVWCGNNPVRNVDQNGMEWFYYSTDGESDPTWNWRDEKEYRTGVYDTNGNEVILQGHEAVVVFEGSLDERLGTKKPTDAGYDGLHTTGYIDGYGAKTAKVTVYGPQGANDIQTYVGYTMSSDPSRYGIVADGIYPGNYDPIGKSGSLKSNWTLNQRGRIPTYWSNPLHPNQIDETGRSYLTGIFIHRTNNSGWAGPPVSKGCLLISPDGWENFNNQLHGVLNFQVQIKRQKGSL